MLNETRLPSFLKKHTASLLDERFEGYHEFSRKTESIYYRKYIKNNPKYAKFYPTRLDFHLASICQGMSMHNYIECATAQGKSPTWCALQIYAGNVAAEFDKHRDDMAEEFGEEYLQEVGAA